MKRISLITIIILILTSYSTDYISANSGNIRKSEWYTASLGYAKIDEDLIQEMSTGSGTFSIEDFNKREQFQHDLLSVTKLPSDAQIESLIKSSNIEDVSVGLVYIFLKKKYSPKIVDILLDAPIPDNSFQLSFYRYRCFRYLPNNEILRVKNKLLKIMYSETSESLMGNVLPIAIRLPFNNSELSDLFVNYLFKSAPDFRETIINYLEQLDREVFQDVKRKISIENKPESSEILSRLTMREDKLLPIR